MKNTAHSVATEPDPEAKRRQGRPSALDPNVGREKIVEATIALLKEHRPGELTQSLVAKQAGIDSKLIRYYFGDLEGLLTIVLERLIDGLGVVMSKASSSSGTATDRMRSRIAALTHYVVEHPNLWKMIADRVYPAESNWAKSVRSDLTNSAYLRLLTVIEDGRRSGDFSEHFDPRLLYVALLGLSEIFVTARPIIDELFVGQQSNMEQTYIAFVVELVLNGIAKRK